MESLEIQTMRAMSWERAKGELNAMLATYYPLAGSLGAGGPDQAAASADEVRGHVEAFIGHIDRILAR